MTDRAKEARLKAMRTTLGKQPTTVDEWLTAKAQFPKNFTVDKEGNLIVPPLKQNESEKTIVLEPEVPATLDHIQSFFANKRTSLKEPEEQYTSAKRNLHEVMNGYKAGLISVSDVLDANHNVHTAECTLNALAKLPRKINTDLTGSLQERDLTMQHYADRPIADTVTQVTYTTFPYNAFWMPGIQAAAEQREKEVLLQQQESKQEEVKPKRILSKEQLAIIAAKRKAASSGAK